MMPDCRNAYGSCIDVTIRQTSFDGAEDRNAPFLFERCCPVRVCFHDCREPDRQTRLLQCAIDAEMIQAEDACAADSNVLYCGFCQTSALARFSLPLNRAKAARVELKQMSYLVFGFRRASGNEARR